MRRYALSRQFLRDFRSLEPQMSPADAALLDRLLAEVLAHPEDTRRIQTFYDPDRPSWLRRADPFMVHYAVDVDRDEILFLNLFRRR